MNAPQKHFHIVLSLTFYKVALTFKFVDQGAAIQVNAIKLFVLSMTLY